MMKEHPWIGVERWNNGQIRARLAAPLLVMLGLSLMLMGISAAIFASEGDRLMRFLAAWRLGDPATFNPKLLLFVLPFMAVLTLPSLAASWRQWRTYRGVALTLDPYPGAIGGQAGGYLEIPVRYRDGMPADVRLNCIRVTRSRGHKNRSRSDSVQWRNQARTRVRRSRAASTRLEFAVDIDPGLPPSDVDQAGSFVYWALRIRLPKDGFDQVFEIPVFDTGSGAHSRIRIDAQPPASAAQRIADISPDTAAVRETAAGFAIGLPAGRSGAMGTILAVVGLMMGAIAAFMWYRAYDVMTATTIGYFPLLVTSMIALGFSLFGIPLFIAGLFVRTNELYVILDDDWLMVERKAFGKRFQTLITPPDVHQISKSVSAQSGRGASSEIYYSIKLETVQGRKITLADGIHGQQNADALLGFLQQRLPGQPKHPAAQHARLPLPLWARYLITGVKLFSLIAVVATVAAFLADFLVMS